MLNGAMRGRRRETEESEVRQVRIKGGDYCQVGDHNSDHHSSPTGGVNVGGGRGAVCGMLGTHPGGECSQGLRHPPAYSTTLMHIVTATDLLSYCNSCVNPIVYGFMSRNFRESFWQVLCCRRYFYHPNMSPRCLSLLPGLPYSATTLTPGKQL
ncbi:Somatostatin receptor type 5-like 1 [Homarus americanus]|uniref:Somatostatin receptor type 5-like 1 n=2 Tax=Homarus americanus TaxID=6706 RepID=A0A8J5TDZ2_HOMAM|nr:Somatostatin receptor type 5-like 1 [Homarus americanus]